LVDQVESLVGLVLRENVEIGVGVVLEQGVVLIMLFLIRWLEIVGLVLVPCQAQVELRRQHRGLDRLLFKTHSLRWLEHRRRQPILLLALHLVSRLEEVLPRWLLVNDSGLTKLLCLVYKIDILLHDLVFDHLPLQCLVIHIHFM
jgi:hypothetical protein